MTDQQLHDAILADATAKALADAGNDSGCAARMAAILPPVVASLPTSQLLIWAASRGVLGKIVAGTSSTNAGVASACLAVQAAINGGAPALDLANPVISATGGLIDGLASAGIFPANSAPAGSPPTPGSKADLLAYGSVSQAVDADQVSRCLIPYRATGH